MANKPIFFDETGRRAARLSLLGWATAILSTILGIAFVASILATQRIEGPQLRVRMTANNQLMRKAVDPALLKSAARLAAEARAREHLARSWRLKSAASPSRTLAAALRPLPGRPLSIGFYVNWDDTSYPALKRALPKLDWVLPSWLSLSGPDMALKITMDGKALKLVQEMRPTVPILPVLQNEDSGTWNGTGLQAIARRSRPPRDTRERRRLLSRRQQTARRGRRFRGGSPSAHTQTFKPSSRNCRPFSLRAAGLSRKRRPSTRILGHTPALPNTSITRC